VLELMLGYVLSDEGLFLREALIEDILGAIDDANIIVLRCVGRAIPSRPTRVTPSLRGSGPQLLVPLVRRHLWLTQMPGCVMQGALIRQRRPGVCT
jgi:hypothetical protein